MLNSYTNQTITRKTIASTNEYNENTYTNSSIKVRFIYKRQNIRTPDGVEIDSKAIVYTKTALKETDLITFDSKDWVVRHVENWVDLNGNVIGYKGVL